MENLFKLILAALGAGSPVLDIDLPKQISGDPGEPIVIQAKSINAAVKWFPLDQGIKLIPDQHLRDTRTAIAICKQPGSYRIMCYSSKNNIPTDPAITTLVVGCGPTPPGPVPPGPAPTPAPIAGEGFRALILYDTKNLSQLPTAQQDILFSADIRTYLNTKAAKGPSGLPDWIIWDAGIDASNDSKAFQDALKLPRSQLPWIIISDGKTGFSGPLPATAEEALKLLQKYGA